MLCPLRQTQIQAFSDRLLIQKLARIVSVAYSSTFMRVITSRAGGVVSLALQPSTTSQLTHQRARLDEGLLTDALKGSLDVCRCVL